MSKRDHQAQNSINLNDDINITVHKNLAQEIIIINIDKLKLILKDHQDALRQKRDWINPLALFLSLLITNLTSTFHDTWSIPANTWQAIFIILCVGALCWLCLAIYNAIRGKNCTIEAVINTIKVAHDNTDSQTTQQTSKP